MTIRSEILQTIQNFLAQEVKPKKAYRAFTANLKRLSETPRLQDLTFKEAELSQIQAKFAQWLESAQKKTKPTLSKPSSPSPLSN
ncbi:4157_t:CDS:2 [Funneliformis geosporum]|uniref:4157_t:CDS:1 n=1 Tax=Funneliformis geosporum TaxID=1117311 RepID=A0A9W4SNE3_9GLOM|nr:4157_t:CDS:2 [Funneliformis geosporum]